MEEQARRGGYSLPKNLIRRELGDIVEEAPSDTFVRQPGLPVVGYTDGIPTNAEVQGPPVPIQIPDATYKIQNPKLRRYHKRIEPYEDMIADSAKRYNVDPLLAKAVIIAESGGRKGAKSPVKAGGLMQLMPGTARYLGVKDRWDPQQNIEGGVKYLRMMMDRNDDDVDLALASYNAGPGNVLKYKGVPPFKETKNYIKKVREYWEMLQDENKKKVMPARPPEIRPKRIATGAAPAGGLVTILQPTVGA